MEVKNPRRILFVGPPDSGILSLLKELTGSSPTPRIVPVNSDAPSNSQIHGTEKFGPESQPEEDSQASTTTIATTAGLTHSLSLKNDYYQAQIPIWIDETSTPEDWKQDFLSDEAGEVIRAIGAWVVCFRLNLRTTEPQDVGIEENLTKDKRELWIKTMMSAIRAAVEKACGGFEMWDGVLLCVGLPSYTAGGQKNDSTVSEAEFEDVCWDYGFEYIDASVPSEAKQSSIGESKGVKRIVEALEANDWEADLDQGEDDDDDNYDFGDFTGHSMSDRILGNDYANLDTEEDQGFAMERREMEKEMLDLKLALNKPSAHRVERNEEEGVEASQVEELEKTMGKVLAVKDMTAHMPESERKRFAARAVRDIMKTI